MKKLLLSMCMAAAVGLMANAKVAVIISDNISYTGADEVIYYPTGYQGDDLPVYTDAFTLDWETPSGTKMAMSVGSFHWYAYTEGILAPTPGITITKINMIVRDPEFFQSTIDGFTKNGNVYTWTGNVSFPDDIVIKPDFYDPKPEGLTNINQPRPYIIEVEYTGTPTAPLMPVASETSRVIASDTPITLTSATPGARIYYTTDGEYPDMDSTPYTGPITLTKDCTLMAVAVDSKNNMSSTLILPFVVAEAGTTIVKYNFTTLDGLTLKSTDFTPVSAGTAHYLKDEYLENGDITIFTAPTYSDPYIIAPTNTCGSYGPYYHLLRVGAKMGITVEALPNQVITDIFMTGTGITKSSVALVAGTEGSIANKGAGSYKIKYTSNPSNRSNAVSFYRVSGTVQFEEAYVAFKDPNAAGVDAIEVDNSNAPVVYYNLQGMQVAGDNLTPGIYVKRQGDKSEKILVK
ncbi:MAG: chitobiase/beta-hexosaminidase C-terminal domain-containing protein [Muribaculaceae bacterium]|nr:chitobiase/beta-hexosaminidase C-terminal domain-containing protein [Muribaculaceae bacterium]